MENGESNMRTTVDFDFDVVDNFVQSAKGKGTLRGEHEHQKSASSAATPGRTIPRSTRGMRPCGLP